MRTQLISYTCISALLVGLILPAQLFAVSNDPFVEQDAYGLIDVYDAWKYTTGSRDVVVAVIDNGFDHYHPDLIENVWNNSDEIPRNGIDDDANGYIDDIVGWNFVPEDRNNDGEITGDELRGNNNPRPSIDESDTLVSGHGTAVAGLIGATGHNGLLGAGLNWRVSLMNLKIVGNSGNGTIQYVPDAIRYAVDNGADVISMSIVGYVEDATAISNAVQYAYEKDVVVVAAAGNNIVDLNTTPIYPICSDAGTDVSSIIGVSAVSAGRAFARFSNYGSDCIDITAPGIGVSSTVRYANNLTSSLTVQYRGNLQGTSFATPLVSGTAALIRSRFPELSAAQVIDAILGSTSKTPPQDEVLYANLFGAGLLQVSGALERAAVLAESPLMPSYAPEYTATVPLSATVTLSFDEINQSVIYHISGVPVRYVSATTAVASVVIHPTQDEIYVLEAATEYGQTISVYNNAARGVRQDVFRVEQAFDGIFFKGSILYGYIRYATYVEVYALSSSGELVLFTVIDVPDISLLTYSESLDSFVGVQYGRMLFSWTEEKGIGTQTYIPLSLGVSVQMLGTLAGDMVSFHDDIAVTWDSLLRSKQLFLYTPNL